MDKVAAISLGCAKNLVDTEVILGALPKSDFVLVEDPKDADIILINTCAFILDAKKESLDTIFEMAKYKGKVVVLGCLAQRYAEELQQSLPEADLIVPIDKYDELPSLLKSLSEGNMEPLNPLRREITTPSYMAYLKISEGCFNRCAFCAIPGIRGNFHSCPLKSLLEEAKILKEKGVKELTLVSQDTTMYGKDLSSGEDIVTLLQKLEEIGFYSIRLLYLYPGEISEELIQFIASSKVIAHYFDIPIQSASPSVLKAMLRKENAKETKKLLYHIREVCPDAIFRTTLISGFPSEKEDDHRCTLEFIKEFGFDHLGVFTYSREEGTPAYSYKNQVSEKVKQKRKEEILLAQRAISFNKAKTHIGEIMEGIVIGQQGKDYLLRSYWNAPDLIDGSILFKPNKEHKEGDIVKVEITSAYVYDLSGKEI